MSDEKKIRRRINYRYKKAKLEIEAEVRSSDSSDGDLSEEENEMTHNSSGSVIGEVQVDERLQQQDSDEGTSYVPETRPESDSSDIEDIEDNEDLDEETGDFFNVNFNKLGKTPLDTRNCLRLWNLHFGVTVAAMNSLLNILIEKEHLELPSTSKTLVQTPKTKISLETMKSGDADCPGEFFYFGIQNQIQKLNYNFLRDPGYQKISLDVGIDGVSSIFKASPLELWPILVGFNGKNKIPPILVAAYWGRGKPSSSNEFLKKFVDEINELSSQGGIFIDEDRKIIKEFEIHHFGCDAPAKSFIKNVQGHTGHNSCNFCDTTIEEMLVLLESGETKMLNVFSSTAGNPRNTAAFRNRDYRLHYKGATRSELERILPQIDMIWTLPNDTMHLLDLGVGKAILNHIKNGNAKNNFGKFNESDVDLLSKMNLKLRKYTPVEFNRKPGSFKYLSHWKATEFRFVMLYSGLILLKHRNIHSDLYDHFVAICFGYRFISTPGIKENNEHLLSAQALFEHFVNQYRFIYGVESVTYNIHNILHIVEAVKLYGSVDKFSNYKFENYLQEIKAHIRKKHQVLQQIYNRTTELNLVNSIMEYNQDIGPFQPFPGITRSYHGYKFNEFTLQISEADCCCKIKNQTEEFIFKLNEIVEIEGIIHVKGQKYLNLVSFRLDPLDSGVFLGIFKGGELKSEVELHPSTHVVSKYVRLPFENEFLFLPMLHHL